jgi:hypothetical protein
MAMTIALLVVVVFTVAKSAIARLGLRFFLVSRMATGLIGALGAVGPVNALTAPLWAVLFALICFGAVPLLPGLRSLALASGAS